MGSWRSCTLNERPIPCDFHCTCKCNPLNDHHHASAGEQPARALHLWRWMYADGLWISDMQETVGVDNGLSQVISKAWDD